MSILAMKSEDTKFHVLQAWKTPKGLQENVAYVWMLRYASGVCHNLNVSEYQYSCTAVTLCINTVWVQVCTNIMICTDIIR